MKIHKLLVSFKDIKGLLLFIIVILGVSSITSLAYPHVTQAAVDPWWTNPDPVAAAAEYCAAHPGLSVGISAIIPRTGITLTSDPSGSTPATFRNIICGAAPGSHSITFYGFKRVSPGSDPLTFTGSASSVVTVEDVTSYRNQLKGCSPYPDPAGRSECDLMPGDYYWMIDNGSAPASGQFGIDYGLLVKNSDFPTPGAHSVITYGMGWYPNVDCPSPLRFSDLGVGKCEASVRTEWNEGVTPFTTLASIKLNRPYIRIDGGDVYAGANFSYLKPDGSVAACTNTTKSTNAQIDTNGYWDAPSSPPYGDLTRLGTSSSQYATFASGEIGAGTTTGSDNFAGNNALSVNGNVKSLLFANTSSSLYGKYSSITVPCINVAALETGTSSSADPSFDNLVNSSDTKVEYTSATPLVISGNTIPLGKKKILVVDAPLVINGDIKQAATTATSTADDLPYLMIIAKQGVKISKNVQNLFGNYISVTDGSSPATDTGQPGTIDTCYDEAPGNLSSSSLTIAKCRNPLTFMGSVMAKTIFLKRTRGSVGDPATFADPSTCGVNSPNDVNAYISRLNACVAEHISFNPQSYIANPINSSSTTVSSEVIQSITLPPIY